MHTDPPPWVYHVEWPLDLTGADLLVAGTARLRIILAPRPVGTSQRDDLVATVVGTLDLPPWTPAGGAPIEHGSALLRWQAGDWHLEARLPCQAAGRALEVHLQAAPGDGGVAKPELGRLTLLLDGERRASGTLPLFFRLFSLFALGQESPAQTEPAPVPWQHRLRQLWPKG
jgi:hypothetical protein